ncbi:MAG TPA: O-methyltransferase [Thermomicrobiaceae bacterium]|nr:O-methyltransferase [Thermomicrobiaceae bacterium]
MARDDYEARLDAYLEGLVPARAPELVAMEEYARQHRFPIIGPAAGQFCYQLARLAGARRVFEMGSGYGYSTAWFARAVRENGGGEVYHVVWDEDLSSRARGHLSRLGLADLIQFRVGEAVGMLEQTDGPFDLIFNDIDKHAYAEALPGITARLRPGGLLIVDNTLWSGRVWDETDQSASTRGIRDFTRAITTDPNWIVSLVPIRDGLTVAYRR